MVKDKDAGRRVPPGNRVAKRPRLPHHQPRPGTRPVASPASLLGFPRRFLCVNTGHNPPQELGPSSSGNPSKPPSDYVPIGTGVTPLTSTSGKMDKGGFFRMGLALL